MVSQAGTTSKGRAWWRAHWKQRRASFEAGRGRWGRVPPRRVAQGPLRRRRCSIAAGLASLLPRTSARSQLVPASVVPLIRQYVESGTGEAGLKCGSGVGCTERLQVRSRRMGTVRVARH